tara:strand:- start:5998 stop:7161 length:1164 start_codon:yes stop_codon:yes gene_type:complete
MAAMTARIADCRRVVVKIGSSLLVDSATGTVKSGWLESLVDDLAQLTSAGADVIVVSSGAIALGRGVLGMPHGALKLEESQAAAAVGQIALARAWSEFLGARGMTAAQVLLTLGDTEERRRYLNARSTIETLLGKGAVPVINENDTVATSEIRYGDNDRLAARVATMASADCLILLSDVEGLFTAPPALDPSATLIPVVERITPEIEMMAGAAGSELSRGGMRTKVEAGRIATEAGTTMVIASGRRDHPIGAIDATGKATWFLAQAEPAAARKTWIAGKLETLGTLVIDDGAVRALAAGKSLLPAGVASVDGKFDRGDAVRILDRAGNELGRGLIAYDSADAMLIAGKNSRAIEGILGYRGRTAMVHRDDLVLQAVTRNVGRGAGAC